MHLATYLSSVFVGFVLGSPAPAPTPPPEFPAVGVIQARVTTSFYSFVTTSIPHNARSIGMGLLEEGTDKYCVLSVSRNCCDGHVLTME